MADTGVREVVAQERVERDLGEGIMIMKGGANMAVHEDEMVVGILEIWSVMVPSSRVKEHREGGAVVQGMVLDRIQGMVVREGRGPAVVKIDLVIFEVPEACTQFTGMCLLDKDHQ
jgi:hypothetical protein